MTGNDLPNVRLTGDAVFKAMVLFTTKMSGLGWPSLPGLLGGVQLINGVPSDPGVEDDWDEVISALGDSDFSEEEKSLSPQAAYEVMFRFLALQFRRRHLETVGEVAGRLSADASSEEAREVKTDWQDALTGRSASS